MNPTKTRVSSGGTEVLATSTPLSSLSLGENLMCLKLHELSILRTLGFEFEKKILSLS